MPNHSSQTPDRCGGLLKRAIREQRRCEYLLEVLTPSKVADACQFDAGSLAACQRILHTMQRGEDVLTDIAALIDLIIELNDAREEHEE